ncbi:MAG TPA: hypothetical protein VFJ70_17435 [Burkholderiales bacterium]|nr:hypothetical protein [Burkholderiales bacterium]
MAQDRIRGAAGFHGVRYLVADVTLLDPDGNPIELFSPAHRG